MYISKTTITSSKKYSIIYWNRPSVSLHKVKLGNNNRQMKHNHLCKN